MSLRGVEHKEFEKQRVYYIEKNLTYNLKKTNKHEIFNRS